MSAPAPPVNEIRAAWDAIADGFDHYTTPHTIALGGQVVSRLDVEPGVRLLDVAAGSGGLSVPAAMVGADVTAVDISPAMIERLQSRAHRQELSTLEARVGDATDLDFDDATFDVTVSMNGVTLLPDVAAGLREMQRVTRPGGTVALVTFGDFPKAEYVAWPLAAMQTAVPGFGPPSAGPLPPFRLADPATLRQTLSAEGLQGVRVETLTWQTRFASVDDVLQTLMASNPLATQMIGGLTDEQLADSREVLDRMLRERSGGHPGAVLECEMRLGCGTVPDSTTPIEEKP